jgi:hypothetical protein
MRSRRALAYGLIPLGLVAGAAFYWKQLRAWANSWGATDAEIGSSLPGDRIVTEPALQTTHAVTIGAAPAAVWPWLVQMGPGRAGAYTYDWVENLVGLNMHSADRIVPEWQHMEVGDAFALGEGGPALTVAEVEPQRALVLALPDGTWSWSFTLEPHNGDQTRLITRNRAPADDPRSRLQWELMLPGAFLMERKMLLGIKERAERGATDPHAA